ncbi:hypothetical protein J5U21_01606 [Saccharolobus shibatae]|uniref:Uncharacterized protein n=1 Tax=Saccharolobus shibatae TaxID=2286 RepID=A0A8F5BV33_9CREN|nr:hypothetical protein J5U21_01606 [Saccharolobus shibatae]
MNIENITKDVIEYEIRQRKMDLTLCDKDKIRFYLSIFLLSGYPTTLYLTKNFVDELLKILNINQIKEITENSLKRNKTIISLSLVLMGNSRVHCEFSLFIEMK